MSTTAVTSGKISLGSYLSIFVPIGVLIATWGIALNATISNHAIKIEQQQKEIENLRKSVSEQNTKIDNNFQVILEKLDKIIYNEFRR